MVHRAKGTDAARLASAGYRRRWSQGVAGNIRLQRTRARGGLLQPLQHVIEDGLRFHTDDRQQTEIGVVVVVLNRMLELGRPDSVRIS